MYKVFVQEDPETITTCYIPFQYLANQMIEITNDDGLTEMCQLEYKDINQATKWFATKRGQEYLKEIIPIFSIRCDPITAESRESRSERSLLNTKKKGRRKYGTV